MHPYDLPTREFQEPIDGFSWDDEDENINYQGECEACGYMVCRCDREWLNRDDTFTLGLEGR